MSGNSAHVKAATKRDTTLMCTGLYVRNTIKIALLQKSQYTFSVTRKNEMWPLFLNIFLYSERRYVKKEQMNKWTNEQRNERAKQLTNERVNTLFN